jgi:hypothetical protein
MRHEKAGKDCYRGWNVGNSLSSDFLKKKRLING